MSDIPSAEEILAIAHRLVARKKAIEELRAIAEQQADQQLKAQLEQIVKTLAA